MSPSPEAIRLHRDMSRVRQEAAFIFPGSYFDRWVSKPNRGLRGETPRDLIERGETEEVLALIDALAEGAFL